MVVDGHRQVPRLGLERLGGVLRKDDEAEGGDALVVEGIAEEKLDRFHNRLIFMVNRKKRQSLAVLGTGRYGYSFISELDSDALPSGGIGSESDSDAIPSRR
ncbi:hypothetical protein GCM10023184_41120 [Flaviaesturariibacter amylovorans]|uniref:Uncharacterized protein n=1 Tax=Flaviaesturariibacter amylovorans TaxID=1084520 RepID=A0ABP8HP11_9BACT